MDNMLTLLCLLLLTIHNSICEAKKVCVIGAGPCGLAAIKAITHGFEAVAFERNSDVGGLWIYTNETDFDKYGLPVHSSMYKNLRTNIPKELMMYSDFRDIRGEKHSCVGHETIVDYLRDYADHFDLRQFIQFNTFVEKVSPVRTEGETNWLVETRNLISNERKQTACHAVMVCNGNLFEPNVPTIPGIKKYPGRVLHSRSYRKPEEFADQTVVILGASFSGLDIAIELSQYAEKIYLSHRHDKIKSKLPSNVEQVPGVVEANDDHLILSNGTTIVADSFILCTGYLYSYPFLDEDSGVVIDQGRFVHPLYKGLINVNYTTMGFLALARDNIGFTTFDFQARYFMSVLRGNTKLPSYDEMLEDSKIPDGVSIGRADDFGVNQSRYHTDLARAANFKDMPVFYEKGFDMWVAFAKGNLMTFRNSDLRVLDDEHVEIVEWQNM